MFKAGIITEKDVLHLLYDMDAKPGKVEDFMTKGVVSFDEDGSLIDITECFLKNSFRRVSITSGGNWWVLSAGKTSLRIS